MGGISSSSQQKRLKSEDQVSSWSVVLCILLTLLLIFSLACMDNFNVSVTGYVRNMADSSAVPGAFLFIGGYDRETNSLGYYEFGGLSPEHEDTIELQIIVADIDGEANGVFVSKDTLVYLAGTQHIQDITFNINFYVNMLEAK